MIVTDEILNKIIDNELDAGKYLQAMAVINKSEELKQKLAALKLADKKLKEITEYTVSGNFNKLIIEKITKAAQYAKAQKHFYAAVITILLVFTLGILVFLLFNSSSVIIRPSSRFSINMEFIEAASKKIQSIFSGRLLTIFSSLGSIIIISIIYFLEESKKIKKLKNS
jgi:hypothetical protein